MKVGTVALIGRPNVGKSTLLNAILGQKVSITSPKPQTTRFTIQAVFEDELGQIIFVDTPGIYVKAPDRLAKIINKKAEEILSQHIDIVVHIIDHTRKRDLEENRTIGIVRKVSVPKILVVNKIDIREPSYREQFKFLEDEYQSVVEVCALSGKNVPTLLNTIYSYLPEGNKIPDMENLIQPAININSKTFIAEIIREKAFLFLRREVPYRLMTVVDDIIERKNATIYIKARILTSEDRYKKMIIGRDGRQIKEISMATRKELEVASSKKIFIDLTVETDPHWIEIFS